MKWLPHFPPSATLVMLYGLARRRFSRNTEDPANLSDARLRSATQQLNAIAEDLGDAGKAAAHGGHVQGSPDS